MTTATATIASHLQIAADLIEEIQEWASVLWVRVKGMSPRFVSKKIATKENTMEVANFYVQDGAFPAYSLDGNNWESGDYCKTLYSAGSDVQEVFSGIASHYHVKMAKDAGGSVVAQTPGWYGSLNETVCVPLLLMQEFAARLRANRNPHEGMMQTSTGEWVLADDWDAIEGA